MEFLGVGLLFVLIFWAILIPLLASPIVLPLLVLSVRGGRERLVRIAKWVALTGILGAIYGLGAFVVYAMMCEARGVDPGIGDSWCVPLPGDYCLVFLDVPEVGRVLQGAPSGEAVVTCTEIGQQGPYIYGLMGNDGFLLDTRTNCLAKGLTRNELVRRLQGLGIAEHRFQRAFDFYRARRWTLFDLLALLLLGGPPVALAAHSLRRAWRGQALGNGEATGFTPAGN